MNNNETAQQKPGLKRPHWWVTAAAAAVLIAAGAAYWVHSSAYEATDDAAIESHALPVSSKVPGQILEVYVSDNQRVKKGDLVARIDPKDYQVRLDQVRAELDAANAEAARAKADAARTKQLFDRDDVSKQVYDKAVADADVMKARAVLASKKVAAAELDLSYTTITAPETGKITKKNAETRAFVQAGQSLMAVVTDDVWVIANFKETQLTHMRPGQEVSVEVDAYPGRPLKGHVDSIQSGTGARFSLLPAENATGNFVKVVQRVPVKIVFDEQPTDMMLVPGMSVVPTVHLK
jgi:membrane fusion protein (multidrug efflux system)